MIDNGVVTVYTFVPAIGSLGTVHPVSDRKRIQIARIMDVPEEEFKPLAATLRARFPEENLTFMWTSCRYC